jgi:hypothetical protein
LYRNIRLGWKSYPGTNTSAFCALTLKAEAYAAIFFTLVS